VAPDIISVHDVSRKFNQFLCTFLPFVGLLALHHFFRGSMNDISIESKPVHSNEAKQSKQKHHVVASQ